MNESLALGLRCIDCGATSPLTYVLDCAACGGLLDVHYDLEVLRRQGPALLTGHGLWR